jgi:hypothetical protein
MLSATAVDVPSVVRGLVDDGFVHLRASFAAPETAWSTARAVCEAAARLDPIGADMPGLEVVGEFAVPPPDAPRRPFQALHLDFGLPVASSQPVAVARFTALHVARDRPPTTARTRLVLLRRLLGQRAWPEPAALLERLREYGRRQHGGGEYVEGILARVVEAADASPSLPDAGAPGFLCGMEFASRAEERAHLAARGLDLDRVEEQVHLEPGGLLVFDNLATAHGRSGLRAPLELRQLCLGYRRLDVRRQRLLLDRVLGAFGPARAEIAPRTMR